MPSHLQPHRRAACRVIWAAALGFAASLPAASPPRPEAQQEYWAQFDRKDWSAAITAAENLVTSARQNPEQPLALAEALSLLGNAQFAKANYIAAEAAYKEALEIVERHGRTTSPKLLEPLRGLGYTLAAAGRHAEAIPYLERSLLISRRAHGLFDIGQQGTLRQLASSLSREGRSADAEWHMTYLLQVGARTYGPANPRLVPLLCTIGDWYAETGNFIIARTRYRAAIDLGERKIGKNDPALLQPLRALARSYTQELYFSTLGLRQVPRDRVPTEADGTSNELKPLNPRYLSNEGEKALERALQIAELQSKDAPAEALLATLIEIGDWFQIKQHPEKALPFYRRAAGLGGGTTQVSATEPDMVPLSFPVRVYYPTPMLATRNISLPAEQVEEKFVQVEFTVTPEGTVRDAKVIERNGSARQATETLQAIRGARFRPKFVNGEPVETAGMTFREVFRARKQEAQPNSS